MKDSLRFIFGFILKERKLFFTGLSLTVMVSILALLGPRIIAFIIDQGLVPHDSRLVLIGVGALGLSELLRLSCSFLSQTTYATLGQNVIERVRKDMVARILSFPVPYFDRVSSGSMMTRVVNDANSLTDFFQSGFVAVLGNFAAIFAVFFGLMNLNLKLGLILLASFIPIAWLCTLFSKKLRRVYENARNQLSELNAMLADFLFGMKTVRALGISEQKHEELNQQVRKYANAQMGMVQTFALFHPTVSLGIGVMLILLIWIGLPLVGDGHLKVGEWVAGLSYVLALQQPLVEISDRWNFFIAGLTSIDRIREVFEEKTEPTGTIETPDLQEIAIEGLSFAHAGATVDVLRDVNLRIRKGDWIGIFGESGSGKSTLLQILYGFYHPTKGSICWNQKAYLDHDLQSLRGHFAVVEQFPFLFSGTIRENIDLFAAQSFPLQELQETFKGFTLIESLLGNLDFEVTERGGNLSMGQKQMITFLRAWLSKPNLWILDEATAFFDQEAEQEVLQALFRLKKNQITVIQVAHKPEALSRMDRMIHIDQGVVREMNPRKNTTESLPQDSK